VLTSLPESRSPWPNLKANGRSSCAGFVATGWLSLSLVLDRGDLPGLADHAAGCALSQRDAVNPALRFSPPLSPSIEAGKIHILGTDHVGRDTFTRLLYAARITLSVAVIVATLSTLIGLTVGALAGYYRGLIDEALMRILEFMSSIPTFPILLILASVLNQDPRLLPFPDFLVNIVSGIMLIDPHRRNRAACWW
jgi:ABC-type dipeptide/oligopeptide/nickel transport system permease subunit